MRRIGDRKWPRSLDGGGGARLKAFLIYLLNIFIGPFVNWRFLRIIPTGDVFSRRYPNWEEDVGIYPHAGAA